MPCLPNEPRKPPAKVSCICLKNPSSWQGSQDISKTKQSLGWITKIYSKKWEGQNKTCKKWHWKPTDFHHTCSKPWRKVAKVSCSSPIISGFTCKAPIISCACQRSCQVIWKVVACFHFAKLNPCGYPRLSISSSSQIHEFSKNKPQRTPKLLVVWPSQYGNAHFYKQSNWRILSEHLLQTSLPPTPLRHFSWVLGHANHFFIHFRTLCGVLFRL